MRPEDDRPPRLREEAERNFSLYHVTQNPEKTDPLGNPFLENYRRYYAFAEPERRCCFCGSRIPEGPVRQIARKDYQSVYGGKLPYWRYCKSCRKISETRIEDLKQFPTCHPEAYVFLCREYEAEKERIEKHQQMMADLSARRKEEEDRKAAAEAERRQGILRQAELFAEEHGGSPDSAKRILAYAKDIRHLDCEYYLTKLEVTEDCLRIYKDGGAHSFFDDGGGETWHMEWTLRRVDENALPEADRGRIADAAPAGEISEIHAGKNYFRNPFGLKGVFVTAYTSSHEYTD